MEEQVFRNLVMQAINANGTNQLTEDQALELLSVMVNSHRREQGLDTADTGKDAQ